MKTITARQFRVNFPTLEEPVSVTINRDGELLTLGTWIPIPAAVAGAVTGLVAEAYEARTAADPIRATSQARRDAILRKISKDRR